MNTPLARSGNTASREGTAAFAAFGFSLSEEPTRRFLSSAGYTPFSEVCTPPRTDAAARCTSGAEGIARGDRRVERGERGVDVAVRAGVVDFTSPRPRRVAGRRRPAAVREGPERVSGRRHGRVGARGTRVGGKAAAVSEGRGSGTPLSDGSSGATRSRTFFLLRLGRDPPSGFSRFSPTSLMVRTTTRRALRSIEVVV